MHSTTHDHPLIGAHTSAAGGAFQALYQGKEIGATAIQLFTSNQKQWKGRKIAPEELALWQKALDETGIRKVMSHDSYLINLGSQDSEMLAKSRTAFAEEIERCHLFGIDYLNFHPGTAGKGTLEQCLETISDSLLQMADLVLAGKTELLLETTAGQGTSVGHRFEHIAAIMSAVHRKIPLGVCIDTCHLFVAGYDIRTAHGWEKVLKEFDDIIGLKHLKAFHINDSAKDLGSRVDRHAHIGHGKIGYESFRFLMQSPLTRHIPKFLETPDGPPVWKHEIELLCKYAKEKN